VFACYALALDRVNAYGPQRVGGKHMQKFEDWWQRRSKHEVVALTVACYVLIALASIDIGRALYQATH
jgi:hypothetical protein